MDRSYFLFTQLFHEIFADYKGDRTNIDKKLLLIYKKIYKNFLFDIQPPLEYIYNRNPNLIVIMTTQFLTPEHAPTAAVLNLAHFLKANGKQVLIVNTADLIGAFSPEIVNKSIPISVLSSLTIYSSTYIPEYNSISSYEYNGYDFPFFQFDNNMPNIEA